jgi:TatD DNase family protein
MKLIDVGVNLMSPSFDQDREQVIKAAAAAGVSPLVITGSSERSSLDAAIFARAYNAEHPGALYTTAGIHPHEAKNYGKNTTELLRELVLESGVRAIGECGLDYNRDFSPRDVQRRCFIRQLELAAELSLPLFLHERDAFLDFSTILQDYSGAVPAILVHCFTGNTDELEHYLSLGAYIGITGWICDERRGKHLEELVRLIPPDRLLLETDSPYLFPRDLPFKVKNKRNESKFLPHIAETVARCLGKEPDELASETFSNAKRFFAI